MSDICTCTWWQVCSAVGRAEWQVSSAVGRAGWQVSSAVGRAGWQVSSAVGRAGWQLAGQFCRGPCREAGRIHDDLFLCLPPSHTYMNGVSGGWRGNLLLIGGYVYV